MQQVHRNVGAFVLSICLSAVLKWRNNQKKTSETILNESDIRWETKSFSELTNLEVYEILMLRCDVFVVEVSF